MGPTTRRRCGSAAAAQQGPARVGEMKDTKRLEPNNFSHSFFPLLYTLQASISKPMAITNSNRHAFDGRTYRRISNQIPIRDPMGSTIPEASGFLITIKRSLNQN